MVRSRYVYCRPRIYSRPVLTLQQPKIIQPTTTPMKSFLPTMNSVATHIDITAITNTVMTMTMTTTTPRHTLDEKRSRHIEQDRHPIPQR